MPRPAARLPPVTSATFPANGCIVESFPCAVWLCTIRRMVNAGKRSGGRPRVGQERLSREAILTAALQLVDDEGIDALTMRRLAATLGVNPMSLYHHLPNKAAVLAGLAELVFAE